MIFFIPAEAHDQLGTIEKHNALWRTAFERNVDTFGVTDDDLIDLAIVKTSDGKNSMVKQYGRTAY